MKKPTIELRYESTGRTIKKYFSIAKWCLIFLIALFTMYGIYSFLTTYGFQNPIMLRNPIYALKREVIVSPLPHGKKQSMVLDLGKIASRIYILESSGGKHVNCPEGTYNGYGFRQNSFEWICYPTQDEARMHVIEWLALHIKNGDIEQSLCLYNRGINEHGCKYALTYASL